MDMKEACRYLKENRRKRNHEHRLKILAIHGDSGFISGFSPSEELRSIKESLRNGKGAGSKSKKAAFNKIWRHYDVPLPKLNNS